MNFEVCDGARLISLLNIRVICEIRVRLLSPRKRIIDSVMRRNQLRIENFEVAAGMTFGDNS